MSILQDLDPKYAKIQRQSSIGNWKLIAWVVSLLLVLTWMGWLIFTLRLGESLSGQGPLKNTAPEQVVIEPPSQKTSPPPSAGSSPIATVAQAEALPASNAGGHALIQDTRSAAPSASNPAQPESRSQAKAELPVAPLGDTKPALKKVEPSEKKSANSTTERKQNIGHTNKETVAPVVVTKKAAERDIDIITAIVR